jgi:hypothetical protein
MLGKEHIMTEGKRPDQVDAELAQQVQEQIDTAQGPGPVLDQNAPDPMPLFEEGDRAGGDVQSAIDPAEFAELSQHTGDQLDQIQSLDEQDVGVAGRAAKIRPVATDDISAGEA